LQRFYAGQAYRYVAASPAAAVLTTGLFIAPRLMERRDGALRDGALRVKVGRSPRGVRRNV